MMTKELINRVKYRYKEYFILWCFYAPLGLLWSVNSKKYSTNSFNDNKSRAKTHANAMKMAANWAHEYPKNVSHTYIADQIVECWERQESEDEG